MRIEWLTAAEDDLREIAKHVAHDFGFNTAEKTVANIVEETSRLSDFPKAGKLCHEYNNTVHQYRALHTRHDRIVYTITENIVLIVAVFDNRRDPDMLVHLLHTRDSYAS